MIPNSPGKNIQTTMEKYDEVQLFRSDSTSLASEKAIQPLLTVHPTHKESQQLATQPSQQTMHPQYVEPLLNPMLYQQAMHTHSLTAYYSMSASYQNQTYSAPAVTQQQTQQQPSQFFQYYKSPNNYSIPFDYCINLLINYKYDMREPNFKISPS